jgi:hypothetical protein
MINDICVSIHAQINKPEKEVVVIESTKIVPVQIVRESNVSNQSSTN